MVYAASSKPVQIMMEMVYRTLQRPESDIIFWTPDIVRQKAGGKILRVTQHKTGRTLEIGLQGQLLAPVEEAIGRTPVATRPIIHNRQGEGYTYSGLDSNLRRAQDKVRKLHPDAEPFGFRDLKGKGATDMRQAGEPIERIQMLCGHKDKRTTEIYVKARWRATVAPNSREIAAA